MNMLLQIPAQIEKIETLSDGSIKIVSITQELTPDDMTTLFALRNKLGWMLFKETRIKEEDLVKIPDEVKEFKEDKTPSQRLRSVLWINWRDNTGQKEDFNTYYGKVVESIIKQFKSKLE